MGAERRNDTEIGDFTTFWETRWIDEAHYFDTFCGIDEETVAEAGYFLAASLQPVRSIFTRAQFVVLLQSTGSGVEYGVDCVGEF